MSVTLDVFDDHRKIYDVSSTVEVDVIIKETSRKKLAFIVEDMIRKALGLSAEGFQNFTPGQSGEAIRNPAFF